MHAHSLSLSLFIISLSLSLPCCQLVALQGQLEASLEVWEGLPWEAVGTLMGPSLPPAPVSPSAHWESQVRDSPQDIVVPAEV
jgi:hypothetical protein